jgi:D-inositol-3-phosphate glycosyltransferase
LSRYIIIGPAYPLRGGIANFNEALCRSMVRGGDDADIISFSLQYPGFLFPGTTQFAEGDPVPEDIKIDTLLNSVNPLSWFSTAREVVLRRPERVFIRYWLPFMAPCLGTVARRIRKALPSTRIVAIADNVIPHESRPGDKQLTRYFIQGCDAFVVMSRSVLSDLRKFDSEKPAVMHPHPVYDIFGNSVEKLEARKALGIAAREKLVLFFGFIRKYKGLDLLLNALADERLRAQNVRLMIAGEFYEAKEPYMDLIRNLGLGERVIMHDFYIPKEHVARYFGAADLVAQPYRDATQSGVTQIAYHFHKPMLVTNVGGLAELVPNGKVGYVTPCEPEKIANAIADFYQKGRETEMIRGVADEASKFSWDSFVETIKTI